MSKNLTKNLKLNIKNPQIADAINLKGLKAKLAKQKEETESPSEVHDPIIQDGKQDEKGIKAKKKAPAKAEVKSVAKEATLDAADLSAEKKKRARTKAKDELSEELSSSVASEKKESVITKSVEEISPKSVPSKHELVTKSEPTATAGVSQVSQVNQGATITQTTMPSQSFQKPPLPKPAAAFSSGKPPAYHSPVRQAPTSYGQASRQSLPSPRDSDAPRRQEYRQDYRSDQRGQPYQPTPFKPKPFESRPPQGQGTEKKLEGEQQVRGDFKPKEFSSPATQSANPAPAPSPSGYQGSRPQQSGYQGSRPPQSGYQGSRPPQSGYQGSRPAQSGYQGSRPQQSGYQGSRPPQSGYQGSRPPQSGYQGTRPPYQGGQQYPQGPRPQGRPDGRFPPRHEGGYPPREGGPYPRREGGSMPPRDFGRDSLARHLPPNIKDDFPQRKESDFKTREARQPDEVKRARGPFEDPASKHKGKQKDAMQQKAIKKPEEKVFDARARHGFVSTDEEEGGAWRRRRSKAFVQKVTQEIVRPSKIKVRLPISIKDLASEMKLKASELISKLFIQGIVVTLNDLLDDPTVVAILGDEFGCEIIIDTAEEERIRISTVSTREEIAAQDVSQLILRPPVVAFMGHVDHGKTSLIDAIRKSNRAAKEVGAITQHIGAFKCTTPQGNLTILDTPGHEAFTLMRERGAGVTDIVVLVIAGDDGIQEQTIEAIKQGRNAKATIVVALTKSDKPNFNPELVFRQLADQELLPEEWGGQTIVVQCSAVTNKGIPELLEMLALQAEVLELRANQTQRARGVVIESEMQQGLGSVATVLVLNGTLRLGDALVFGDKWARVKTMRDEIGQELIEAVPSTPVQITGLSGLPEAGEEFIVVKSEKEAREIAEARQEGKRQTGFQVKKRHSLESLMENAKNMPKKMFTLILRADVQGSLEALVKALEKIQSDKVELNIISQGVGQISESDVQLAATSKACIIGFHTQVETHAELMIKELGVKVLLHNIIYHVVDVVREEMKSMLDKLAEEVEKGKAEVKAIFKASLLGVISGCQVTEGSIMRNCQIRVRRGKDVVFKGPIASLKRVKEDVKEVQKGIECGILLSGYNDTQVGDILEAFDIIYVAQEL